MKFQGIFGKLTCAFAACLLSTGMTAAHAGQAAQQPVPNQVTNQQGATDQDHQSRSMQGQPDAGIPATTAASTDYVIGPSDSLEISVWKEPTLSGTLPVRPDGMISLSLIGDLQASGLTPMQLSHEIAMRLKRYINDPLVNVSVLGVNSRRIFLLGEIAKPGELPLQPGMTPLQAIASAGGLSAYANARKIYILRTVGGKQEKIAFDYKKAIKTGNLQGVTLFSGDTIVVP